MVIGAANLCTIAGREFEYDSILLVHADTVEASECSSQLLQSISGRYPQVVDRCAGIQHIEFLLHPAPEFASNPAGSFAIVPVIDVGGRRIPEAGDHKDSIPEYPLVVYSCESRGIHVRIRSHSRPTPPRVRR